MAIGAPTLMGPAVSAPTVNVTGAGAAGAAAGAGGFSAALGAVAPWLMLAGAVSGAIGSYYSAKSQQYQLRSQASTLRFQSAMSDINARAMEFEAQNILRAGERQIGMYTQRAGQIRGATRASMAARGGVLGEGSNVEIQASQDLAKEIDVMTINANTVRAAAAARTQMVNIQNQALLQRVSAAGFEGAARTIQPLGAAATSLLGSASSAAPMFYPGLSASRKS